MGSNPRPSRFLSTPSASPNSTNSQKKTGPFDSEIGFALPAAYRLTNHTNLHKTHTLWFHFSFDHQPTELRKQFTLLDGGLATHEEMQRKFCGRNPLNAEQATHLAAGLTQDKLAQMIGTTVKRVGEGSGLLGVVSWATLKKNGGHGEVASITRACASYVTGSGTEYEVDWLGFLKRSLAGPPPASCEAVFARRREELLSGVLYDGAGASLSRPSATSSLTVSSSCDCEREEEETQEEEEEVGGLDFGSC